MTAEADPGCPGAAVLTFAGGLLPVRLDGAVLHSRPSGTTTLSGLARSGALAPGGELCLPLAEYGNRRWSVADVHVEVAPTGDRHDRVIVSWHSGLELEAVDPNGRYRVEVAWLLRARTLKLLPLDDLIDGRLAPYALALASGLRDRRVARRLELACNEIATRDPLVTPRRSRRSAETGPLRLLHDVTAAGGHLAATTGTVRARAESRDRLAVLSLVTFPSRCPPRRTRPSSWSTREPRPWTYCGPAKPWPPSSAPGSMPSPTSPQNRPPAAKPLSRPRARHCTAATPARSPTADGPVHRAHDRRPAETPRRAVRPDAVQGCPTTGSVGPHVPPLL